MVEIEAHQGLHIFFCYCTCSPPPPSALQYLQGMGPQEAIDHAGATCGVRNIYSCAKASGRQWTCACPAEVEEPKPKPKPNRPKALITLCPLPWCPPPLVLLGPLSSTN